MLPANTCHWNYHNGCHVHVLDDIEHFPGHAAGICYRILIIDGDAEAKAKDGKVASRLQQNVPSRKWALA